MKKKIFTLVILLASCLVILLVSCIESPEYTDNATKQSRFVVVEYVYDWKVVYDKETLVMYAVSNEPRNSGVFTLLVDEDGKPLLWKGGDQ